MIVVWLFVSLAPAVAADQPTAPLLSAAATIDSVADMSAPGSIIRAFCGLLAVLALAYLLLHKGLGHFMQKTSQGRNIKLCETHRLDPRRTLYLVEVNEIQYLLGGTDSQITLISTIPPTTLNPKPGAL